MAKQSFEHCNFCGTKLTTWDLQEDYTIHTTCGYGSSHDGDTVRLQLCCDCFDKIVDHCEISPVVVRSE